MGIVECTPVRQKTINHFSLALTTKIGSEKTLQFFLMIKCPSKHRHCILSHPLSAVINCPKLTAFSGKNQGKVGATEKEKKTVSPHHRGK